MAVVGLRPLHPHGIRLDGQDERRLELVRVAAELLPEPGLDRAPERGQIGDRDPHAVGRVEVPHDDPQGRLRRDAGVDDREPARALANETRQEVGQERHEGLDPEVLASRVTDEGGIVAERDDGSDEHGQRLRHAPPELAGDQVVGPEREVRPMLLGRRTHGHEDDGPGGDARTGFRPGEILEEHAPHRRHLPWSQRSRNDRTHGPQIGAPFWKNRCPSSAVSPKAGNTRATYPLP